jgi:hypothetical protein
MFILGFTDEDVTGAWQHWRLATECGSAFEDEGLSASFGILESPGQGRYLVQWYVCDDAASILDRRAVNWRRFLIGQQPQAPRGAHAAVLPATRQEREVLEERKRAGHK